MAETKQDILYGLDKEIAKGQLLCNGYIRKGTHKYIPQYIGNIIVFFFQSKNKEGFLVDRILQGNYKNPNPDLEKSFAKK